MVNSTKNHSLKRAQLIPEIHNTLELFPEKLGILAEIFGGMDDPVLEKLSSQYTTQ